MRSICRLAALPLALTLALSCGCTAPASEGGSTTGVLVTPQRSTGDLQVWLQAARSTQATTSDIDRITVSVQLAGTAPLSQSVSKSQLSNEGAGASLAFNNLLTGPATVSVQVLDTNGAVIGLAKNSTTIFANQTATMTFNIQLVPDLTNATFGPGGLATTITLTDGGSYFNAGTVATLAGGGTGYQDGLGAAALFNNPTGLALDGTGNLYVADTNNNRIRKVTPQGSVTTFVGSTQGYSDSTGTAALFYRPSGLVVDSAGNVYVADTNNNRIRKVTPQGVVTTLAGGNSAGAADGTGTLATFNKPQGLTMDRNGLLYVADTGNNRIRTVTAAGQVSTLAGTTQGYVDAVTNQAAFNAPTSVAVDNGGNVYVADSGNHCIRKFLPGGTVSTLAGNGTAGFADGAGPQAMFNRPSGLAVDTNNSLYVVDTLNNTLRKVTFTGGVTTLAGQTQSGYLDASGTNAQFNNPGGVAVTATGSLYVADTLNARVRTMQ